MSLATCLISKSNQSLYIKSLNHVIVLNDQSQPYPAVCFPEKPSDHVSGARVRKPESCFRHQE